MKGLSRTKMIVAIVVGAVGAIVVLQNFQRVDTMILFWRVTLPHVVLLAVVFGAGLALGVALSALWLMPRLDRRQKP
jgi:uncharacterized integral membrane protein